MKAKKVLSLVLAVLMVFSVVPAALFANASTVSDATSFSTYVTYIDDEDAAFNGCVDLQFSVKSTGTDAITTLGQTYVIDPTVLSTVDYNTEMPNLDTYKVASKQFGNDFALEAKDIKVGKRTYNFTFGGTGLCSYNATTDKLYVFVCGMSTDSIVIPNESTLVADVYFKLQPGKTVEDIPGAIKLMTLDEFNNPTSGCPLKAIDCGGISSKTETYAANSIIDRSTISFDSKFTPTMYDITFNWKDADGDKNTVVSTKENTVPVAPTASTANYSTADYDYTFAGWDKEIVAATSATAYTATYTKSADKSALQTEYDADKALVEDEYQATSWSAFATALADAKTVLDNADATKVEIQNALTALTTAKGNLVELKKFNITFSWENAVGTQTQIVSTKEGTIPAAPAGSSDNFIKDNISYTFTGWDKEVVAATGDVTYTAQYSAVSNVVNITFVYKDANGEQNIVVPTVKGEMPVVPVISNYTSLDGDTTYTFTGWDVTPVAATIETTYTAQYTEATNYANYDAVDVAKNDAKEITDATDYSAKYTEASRQALATALAGVIENLPKSRQTDVDAMAEAINQAITNLTLNKYTVTFNYNNVSLSDTFNYGSIITSPPVEDYTEGDYKYSLDKWDPEFVASVTADVTYNAVYTKTFLPADLTNLQTAIDNATEKKNNGTRWNQSSLSALNEQLALANDLISLNPGITKTAQIADLVTSINTAAENLAEIKTVTATFSYMTAEGQKTAQVVVDEDATPAVPTGADANYEDADYNYTFKSWSPELSAISENTTYTAQYTKVAKGVNVADLDKAIADAKAIVEEENYSAKYTADSRTVLEREYEAAKTLRAGELLASNQPEINAKSEALNNAIAGLAVQSYDITFSINGKDTVVPTAFGAMPVAPTVAPYADGNFDNSFSRWDKEIVAVTGEATYTALYNSTFVKADYTENAAAIAAAKVITDDANVAKIYTADTLKTLTDAVAANELELGRTQQDFVNASTKAINDAITALAKTVYTVTFTANGEEYSKRTYNFGDTVIVPANPTKPATVSSTYSFFNWNPEVAKTVEADATYEANFYASPRVYDIAFVTSAGTTLVPTAYGATPVAPTVADYSDNYFNYTFKAWDVEIAPVSGEATYTATYDKTDRMYTINFVVNGEKVSTQSLKYSEMPVVPTVGDYDEGNYHYTFKSWNPTVTEVAGDATYTAVFTKTSTFTPDMSRIEQLVEKYNQMVKTGKFNKEDLATVKAYIEDIYSMEFEDQATINEMAAELDTLEKACRKVGTSTPANKDETNKENTASTGDNVTIVVMSVILVCSLGLAVVSLKRRKKEENM